MKELLNRFSLDAIKFNTEILLILILLWIIVVACSMMSISGQPFSRAQRKFWMIFVAAVPVVGLLAYLPFSFRKEELPHIFLPKRKREKKRQAAR